MQQRRQTLGEEIANSVTHGIGAALSIAALVALLVLTYPLGNARRIVACSIYGSSLVLCYLSSTLYHSLPGRRMKQVFRILDHASIYFLIAGTYTPITLVAVGGGWGWSLFAVVWALALSGVIFKSLFVERWETVSTAVYVVMGWLAIVAFRPLTHALAGSAVLWLIAGGVVYSAGVFFFAAKHKYAHMVWHLFVIGGSVCHFIAIYLCVVRGNT